MPPVLRKRKQVPEPGEEETCEKKPKNEPESTSWFDIPLEMREMVIDKMDAKTRCEFTRCSTKCEDEVKASKNHLYSLHVFDCETSVYISFKFEKEARFHDFCMKFRKSYEKETKIWYRVCMFDDWDDEDEDWEPDAQRYFGDFGHSKWRKKEEGKWQTVVLKYLKNYLEVYKNSIRELEIFHYSMPLKNIDIKNLKRLEHLDVRFEKPRCKKIFSKLVFSISVRFQIFEHASYLTQTSHSNKFAISKEKFCM
ncbi:unnamed protein product [Caenorhabditis angaria]|uniref:F-box domain-containing protein n=1 Tax=Caenorhabditis angaria TaxID=860376 RepID=A0A9P1N054_9PELO|nr:unnamed protein product [Caenorhabditis angaria]